MPNDLVLISGSAHPVMGERIAECLKTKLLDVEIGRFSDGEINIKILENIRGTDVFIIQPTMPPAENMLELLLMIDAVRRASCRRVTAVIPYFGYARQDRKDQPRVPIGAKLMADLITGAGANRVLTIDLHAPQIQGFFNIPLDHLYSAPVLLKYFWDHPRENMTVVAPDVGSIKMTRAFAKRLDVGLAIIDKRRPRPNEAVVMNFIGEVAGKDVITHPLLSGQSLQRLNDSPIKEVVVSNTIPFDRMDVCPKIRVLDMGPLLAQAIERIHLERTVSELFV